MRAVAIDEYGETQTLRVRDADEPKLGPDTVLVEVAAGPWGERVAGPVRGIAPAPEQLDLAVAGRRARRGARRHGARARRDGRGGTPGRAGRATPRRMFVRPHSGQLAELARLADAGELVPHVQSTHPLADVRGVFEESMAGVRGKVVLTMRSGS